MAEGAMRHRAVWPKEVPLDLGLPQTSIWYNLEVSATRYPEKPQAGPFFANLGAFLMGLTYGLPGIRLGPGEPHEWACRPVVLPEGWRSIEIERAWVRMQPARIVARHGAERAAIELSGQRRRRAA